MSYSRRELGFVDDLVRKLEGEQYHVWLDYRALIPGSPWNVQIEKGLNEADTVLLVVSKAALSSVIPDARVEKRVRHVDQEIESHHHGGDERAFDRADAANHDDDHAESQYDHKQGKHQDK